MKTALAPCALAALIAAGGCGGSSGSSTTVRSGQAHPQRRISTLPPRQRAKLRRMLREASAAK